MAKAGAAAQGWYWDPYREHEDRYFSDGQPTDLVRDGARESFDPPPDRPVPAPLVPAASDMRESRGLGDLHRAGETEGDAFSDRRMARDRAIRAMVRYGAAR
jgi:hypothetical protein